MIVQLIFMWLFLRIYNKIRDLKLFDFFLIFYVVIEYVRT